MGQILHGSATTTEAVRRAIQNNQASLRELAGRYGINPKTVAKWRRRSPSYMRRPIAGQLRTSSKPVIKAVPYKIHTVLTDNGIQFTDLPKNRLGPTARWRVHMFDMLCQANGIEHRLTKPNHPWTNGQVERMNRTLKEATVQRYHYGTHTQLKAHVHAFLMAYNFAKRLKTLRGLTPYEHICKVWTTQPNRFRLNPLHHTVGLNN